MSAILLEGEEAVSIVWHSTNKRTLQASITIVAYRY